MLVAVDQIDGFVVVVIVIIFKMFRHVVKRSDTFEEVCYWIIFWNE